jgi:hypothetical protein
VVLVLAALHMRQKRAEGFQAKLLLVWLLL